jgi:hypothetical protein
MAARQVVKYSASSAWGLSKPEVYPVVVCMAAATAWVGYVGTNFLARHPEVKVSVTQRGTQFRQNQAEGRSWVSHRSMFRSDNHHELESLSLPFFTTLNKSMTEKKQ